MRELLIAVLLGCGSPQSSAPPPTPGETPTPTEPAPPPPPSSPATPTQSADGGSCLKHDDCASGICEGQGCDANQPGTCAPKQRGCTRDRRDYCGCDGVTFFASGTCPGQRFRARGACKASAP